MRSYSDYNIITKSALIYRADEIAFDLRSFAGTHAAPAGRRSRRIRAPHAIDRLNLLAARSTATRPRCRASSTALSTARASRASSSSASAPRCSDVAAALHEAFPDEERDAVDAEALLILSRLLFLSFVQEKGWLNGERRFLVDRLEQQIRRGGEFFSGRAAAALLRMSEHAAARADAWPRGELGRDSVPQRRSLRAVVVRAAARGDASAERADAARPRGRVREVRLPHRRDRRGRNARRSGDARQGVRVADGRGRARRQRQLLYAEGDRRRAGRARHHANGSATVREVQLEKLERITILDPACGSGAFLLSALGVDRALLARAHERRAARSAPPHRGQLALRRRPEAARRCGSASCACGWPSSPAATPPIDEVEPLPNLDRNILQGNSLLSPTDFLGDARLDIYADWLHALRAQRDLLERYRTAPHAQRPALYRLIRGNDQRLASELLARSDRRRRARAAARLRAAARSLRPRAPVDPERCRELQQRIAEQKKMLEPSRRGALDFFSFDVHFAHVMARRRLRRRGRQPAVGAQQPHRRAREADARRSLRAVPRRSATARRFISRICRWRFSSARWRWPRRTAWWRC